eukprot:25937-Rhodomonas_salina.1
MEGLVGGHGLLDLMQLQVLLPDVLVVELDAPQRRQLPRLLAPELRQLRRQPPHDPPVGAPRRLP